MKMNATKLTIALVALLLALTCVFAACGKKNTDKPDDTTPVDNTPAVDTVAKEDLNAIAESLKAAYVANYVDLYAPATANEIDAAKSAALINIFAATSKEEAQKVADDFITYLKSQKTIIDSIAALVEKIGDVSLKDADALNQLADVVETLDNAYAGDNAAKQAALDAYKADAATQKTIKEIVDRYNQLKAAKKDADVLKGGTKADGTKALVDGLNANIADMKADFTKADKDFTLVDFNNYEALLKAMEKFAEKYALEVGTDAYADVFDTVALNTAKTTLDDAFKKDSVLSRMLTIVNEAKALKAAANEALWREYIYVDASSLKVQEEENATYNIALNIDGETKYGTFAYALNDTIGATGNNKANTAIELPDGTVKYYDGPFDDNLPETNPAYKKTAYAFTAYATEEAAAKAKVVKTAKVEAKITVDYKLSLQGAVKTAVEAMKALMDDYSDPAELTEKYGYYKDNNADEAVYAAVQYITNTAAAYNTSAARAYANYAIFNGAILAKKTNVDLYKEATHGTYALSKETELDKNIKFTNKKASVNQTNIKNAIDNAIKNFTAQNEDTGSFYTLNNYDHTGAYNAAAGYEFDLVNNSPAISYTAWTYRYQLEEKNDLAGTTSLNALKLLANNVNGITDEHVAATTAKKALRWLAMYISEGEFADSYNLYEYKDAGFKKTDVLYMVDRDITEVAVPGVVKIHGEAVNVAKDETDIGAKLLSPYTVAKALVAEEEKIDAAKEEAKEEIKAVALALKAVGDANAVDDAVELKDKIENGQYVDAKLGYDLDFVNKYGTNTYLTGDETCIKYLKVDLTGVEVLVQEKPEQYQDAKDLINDANVALTKATDAFKAVEKERRAVDSEYITLLDNSVVNGLKALADKVTDDKDGIAKNNDFATLYAAYMEVAEAAIKTAEAGENAGVVIKETDGGDTNNINSAVAKANKEKIEMIGYIFSNYGNFDNAYGASTFLGLTLANGTPNAVTAADFSNYVDKAGSYDFSDATANGTGKGFLDAYWNSDKVTEKQHVAIAYQLADIVNSAVPATIDTTGAKATKDNTALTADLKADQKAFDEALEAYEFKVLAKDAFKADATIVLAENAIVDFADTYFADYVNLKVSYKIGDEVFDLDLFTEVYRERLMSNSQKVIKNILDYATAKETAESLAAGAIKSTLTGAAWEDGVTNRVNNIAVKFETITSKKTGDNLIKSYEFADSTYSLDTVLKKFNDKLATDITMKDLRTEAYK